MRSRLLVAALALLAVVSAALATAIVRRIEHAPASTAASGAALIGGPFTLTDDTGRRVTEQDFRGRYMLVYFGYTYCPDVCPLGLQVMAQALDLLPPAVAGRITPVFITVDPERDTVAVIHDYVRSFHPTLVGLTGSTDEINDARRAFRVYAGKNDFTDGTGYTVDHSTFTYLMGPDGGYITHFVANVTAEAMANRIFEAVGADS